MLLDDQALLTYQFAAAVGQLPGVLVATHTRLSGCKWVPAQEWAYSGGDLTIAVGGSRVVLVRTGEADFN